MCKKKRYKNHSFSLIIFNVLLNRKNDSFTCVYYSKGIQDFVLYYYHVNYVCIVCVNKLVLFGKRCPENGRVMM